MVKNTHGGNKSKGMARKNMVSSTEKRTLRLSTCEHEKYAVVTKLLGNGMFYTTTSEGHELLGHIRNKFKGRSRRGNDISIGTIILAGLRDWEAPNFKDCDLLEVYDPNEVQQLRLISTIDFTLFLPFLEINLGTGTHTGTHSTEHLLFDSFDDSISLPPSSLPPSSLPLSSSLDLDSLDLDSLDFHDI
jgi:translation initiation factor IF-1